MQIPQALPEIDGSPRMGESPEVCPSKWRTNKPLTLAQSRDKATQKLVQAPQKLVQARRNNTQNKQAHNRKPLRLVQARDTSTQNKEAHNRYPQCHDTTATNSVQSKEAHNGSHGALCKQDNKNTQPHTEQRNTQ